MKTRQIIVKERHKAIAKEIKRQIQTNDHKPITDVLEEVGNYKPSVALHQSKRIMTSPSMQEALRLEGINVESVDRVVTSIVNTPKIAEMITPDNVLRGADMLYKRMGAYKDGTTKNTLNINIFSPEQAKAIAERLIQKSLQSQEE